MVVKQTKWSKGFKNEPDGEKMGLVEAAHQMRKRWSKEREQGMMIRELDP